MVWIGLQIMYKRLEFSSGVMTNVSIIFTLKCLFYFKDSYRLEDEMFL